MASKLVSAARAAAPRLSALRPFTSQTESFKLADLPFGEGELEPVISGSIMEVHYGKHHRTYVNNLNIAVEKYKDAEAKGDVAGMIAQAGAIRFHGGGHFNHTIQWSNLAPVSKGGGQPPTGALAQAITKDFGSLDTMIEKFNALTGPVQGSGWGWLGYNPTNKSLTLATTANQDLLSAQGLVPLLTVDVWEHAYYLQYKNLRPDYLKAIWQIVNWKNVEERYAAATK